MFGGHSTIATLAAVLLAGVGGLCVIDLPPLAVLALVAVAVVLARLARGSAGVPALRVALVAAALILAAARIDLQIAQRWPASRADHRALVVASIDSLPALRGGEWLADADVRVLRPACSAHCALRLRIAGPLGRALPRAGERWQLLLRIGPPRARVNPGGVDLERQWLLERVQGVARVVDSSLNRRLAGAGSGWLPLRERLRDAIADRIADREARALITALAIGDTGAMSPEQWQVFSTTGTTHLVAISGMHVTLFAWVVAWVVRGCWRHFAPLRRVRRDSAALTLGAAAALAYSLLAGFSIPTQRTVVMLACAAAARLAGRELSSADVLGAAAIGVLLFDPLAPLDLGFWLSFGAMAALMLAGGSVSTGWTASLRGMLREQAWLGVALAPLTLLLFGRVSMAGLVTNFVAIPVFSFALVPLSLAGTLLLPLAPESGAALLRAAAGLHDPCWRALQWLATPSWASWAPGIPAAWHVFAALALLLLWLPVPGRLRATAGFALLPLLAAAPAGPRHGAARVTVLDAGDGGAALVLTQRHALLFGTGASFGTAGAAVDQHVLPAMRAAGLGRLDAVVLSRASAAEVEGLARLLAAVPVRRVWVGDEWPAAPATVRDCPPRLGWTWDGIAFELQGARIPVAATAYAPGACVLRLRAAGRQLLLAGPIPRGDMAALLGQGASLRADLLIGPARAGSGAPQRDWAAAVRPDWLVATRARLDDAALARSAAAHGVAAASVLSPARQGPLRLDLEADGSLRAQVAIDPGLVPRWRVAREPLSAAVLAAPVRYDPRLTSSGDTGQCGRSCGQAVR